MEIQGKTVLITGAALRIGREIALDLSRCGARVIIHYCQSQKAARMLAGDIRREGGEASLLAADFSKPGTAVLVRHIQNRLKREKLAVDVLINNASVFYPAPLKKINEKNWEDMMRVNLKAPFFLAREFGLEMAARKQGKIIQILDWTVQRPHPDYLPYIISKSGLLTATLGLAKALAPHVQVNGIAPGPILEARGMTPGEKKRAVERTALKRFGHPRDIAAAVRYLIEGSDFVTGTVLPVEGGSLIM
ncbi:MAG: hypothetical protein A2Z83_09525 [Omnitrophica bacterium GWA2_52_8]|nr:MAG: hypothetical protein A2Z83_09525 [Omnitrophica bacterium GWA2_52_8]